MDDTLEPLPPEVPVVELAAARRSRGRFVPYAVAAGVLAIAGIGYLAGSAHAGTGNDSQKVAAANAVNASLAAATTPAPSAAVCEPAHRGVAGTLKAINGSSLVVTRAGGGTVTVKTNAATVVRKTVSGAVSDIKVGQTVAVHGTSTGQNAIAAAQVALLPTEVSQKLTQLPPIAGRFAQRAPQLGFAVGTVAKAANGTFTVTEPGGTSVAVTTSSTTKVIKTVDVAVKDLTVGQPVVAIGTVNSDGSVSAAQVDQGTADLGFGFGFDKGFGPFGPGFGAIGPGRFGGRRGTGTGPGTPATPATPAAPASIS
jgi:Domain of unknown function (DUF5666)